MCHPTLLLATLRTGLIRTLGFS
uniref:Uncharacterized protein n=1 Tax=Anguilla anguilla TaxID=7936 RepID=A0A0E9RTX7_ANGAN